MAVLASLGALAGALLAPSASRGQGGSPAAINGTWRLTTSVPQAEQLVAQAVEPAVQPLAPDIQHLARARIAETTWVPHTITVNATPAQILITYAGASQNRTFDTAPGQPRNVYSPSGVRAQLTQLVRPDGGVQQSFRAMDGMQYNQLSAHGNQMFLDVQMTSRRLAREVRFRLTYRR